MRAGQTRLTHGYFRRGDHPSPRARFLRLCAVPPLGGFPPILGAAPMMRSASRLKGRLCNHTFPGPRNVARKRPSPPKTALRTPPHHFDIVIHGLRKGDKAARIDAKHIGRTEFARDHCSARVKEGHAVSFKFLHDKALTAEEPCAESALKFDTDRDPFCSAEKGIFPANDFSVEQVEVCGNNFPGKGAAKVTWRFP